MSDVRVGPILFQPPMVRAMLAGNKTQTRRMVNPQPTTMFNTDGEFGQYTGWLYRTGGHPCVLTGEPVYVWRPLRDLVNECRYGKVGDLLYVREGCRAEELDTGMDGVRYLADDWFEPIKSSQSAVDAWLELNSYRGKQGAVVPSIHMPRRYSRLTLRLTDVRVQRPIDITEGDAIAEGATSRAAGWSMDWGRVGQLSRFAGGIHGARDKRPLTEKDIALPTAKEAFLNYYQLLGGDIKRPAWALSFEVIEQQVDEYLGHAA